MPTLLEVDTSQSERFMLSTLAQLLRVFDVRTWINSPEKNNRLKPGCNLIQKVSVTSVHNSISGCGLLEASSGALSMHLCAANKHPLMTEKGFAKTHKTRSLIQGWCLLSISKSVANLRYISLLSTQTWLRPCGNYQAGQLPGFGIPFDQ